MKHQGVNDWLVDTILASAVVRRPHPHTAPKPQSYSADSPSSSKSSTVSTIHEPLILAQRKARKESVLMTWEP